MIDHLRIHLLFKIPIAGTSLPEAKPLVFNYKKHVVIDPYDTTDQTLCKVNYINKYEGAFLHTSQDNLFGWCEVKKMGIPLSANFDMDGNELVLKTVRSQYQSLSSGWSGMSFKVHDNNAMEKNKFPFIEIKMSPAKGYQAHNVTGTDNLEYCVNTMLQTLFFKYPHLENLIDFNISQIRHIDINYSVKVKNHDLAKRVIAYLSNISGGQSKGANTYPTSHYWGGKTTNNESDEVFKSRSGSRHKANKVYLKYEEIMYRVGEFLNSGHTSTLKQNYFLINAGIHNSTLGLLRFETRLKDRFLKSAGIPLNIQEFIRYQRRHPNCMEQLFQRSFKDIFKTMKGHKMTILDDDKIKTKLKKHFDSFTKKGNLSTTKSDNYYKTYSLLKSHGFYWVKENMNRMTLHRHFIAFSEIGISKAYLQNLGTKENNTAQVIPFTQFVDINFKEQDVPVSELPVQIYDFMANVKPQHLRLVA